MWLKGNGNELQLNIEKSFEGFAHQLSTDVQILFILTASRSSSGDSQMTVMLYPYSLTPPIQGLQIALHNHGSILRVATRECE